VDVKRIAYLPFGGQGITHNGTFWYYSATWWRHHTKRAPQYWREGYLYKLDPKFRIVKHVYAPLLYTYDHIGGIDYFKNKIYASLEDPDYVKPRITVFDDNLELLEVFRIPRQYGCPWVAIHNNLLYTSEFITKYINVFTLTGKYVTDIRLEYPLFKIQGGKFYKNELYLACDNPTKSIFKVSLDGAVKLFIDTKIKNEMEDIHITKDGTIYFIDHLGHLYEVLE